MWLLYVSNLEIVKTLWKVNFWYRYWITECNTDRCCDHITGGVNIYLAGCVNLLALGCALCVCVCVCLCVCVCVCVIPNQIRYQICRFIISLSDTSNVVQSPTYSAKKQDNKKSSGGQGWRWWERGVDKIWRRGEEEVRKYR